MDNKIKIVTQNCIVSLRTAKVIRMINKLKAHVYCLQEIRSQRIAEIIKKKTNLDYIFSNSHHTFLHISTFNVLYTNLPILNSGELEFIREEFDGRDHFVGTALWATVNYGRKKVRIYNCYLNISRCGMKDRDSALRSIIKHSAEFKGPIVICGDMNTSIPTRKIHRRLLNWFHHVPESDVTEFGLYAHINEKYYFYDLAKKLGFQEITDINYPTWTFPLPKIKLNFPEIKLDWFLIKNFRDYEYKFGPFIGDHKSIISELTI